MIEFIVEILKHKPIKIFSISFIVFTNFLLGLMSLFIFEKEIIIKFDIVKLIIICSSIYLPFIIMLTLLLNYYYQFINLTFSHDENQIFLDTVVTTFLIAILVINGLYNAYKDNLNVIEFTINFLSAIPYMFMPAILIYALGSKRKLILKILITIISISWQITSRSIVINKLIFFLIYILIIMSMSYYLKSPSSLQEEA